MFNINRFRSEIETNGVLRNNTFEVDFVLPLYLRQLKSPLGITEDRITLRCESATLPGIGWNTLEGAPRIGYGPIESIPYSPIYDETTLTFLVDSKALVHKLFYQWFNTIVNLQSRGQTALKDDNNGPTRTAWKPYEVGYRQSYTTDVNITLYDTAGPVNRNTPPEQQQNLEFKRNKVLTVTLFNAFPKLFPSVDLSWLQNDEVVRMSIPFSYVDYTIVYNN